MCGGRLAWSRWENNDGKSAGEELGNIRKQLTNATEPGEYLGQSGVRSASLRSAEVTRWQKTRLR
jgi:hypothetical protein